MTTQKFPLGATVTTYPAPPQGFDMQSASDAVLAQHGMPSRSAHPTLAAKWAAATRKTTKYVVPKFTYRAGKYHKPRIKAANATETSTNWCGGVVFAPAGKAFKWVSGVWTIPNVNPATTDGSVSYCASWIGIDGDNSDDVLQAGVECEVRSAGGQVQRNIYAWWEWFPEAEVSLDNFPVAAGDEVSLVITVEDGSTTMAKVMFSNQTQGTATSFEITAPTGTMVTGNCAEWIVERPSIGGQIAGLALYDMVTFSGSDAGLAGSSGTTVGGATGDKLNMTDDSGHVVSKTTLVPPDTIRCAHV
jgi:hypothetical protein